MRNFLPSCSPAFLLTCILALLPSCFLLSQDDFINDTIRHPKKEEKKNSFWSWDKVSFGGSLGALFGDPTFIDLSPTMGYHLHKNLQVGVGPVYNYYKSRQWNREINIYGGRIFARPYLFQGAFLHAEYELLNGNVNWNKPTERYNISGLLLGGGYQQSAEGGFFILALWEVLKDQWYPYPNPILRMGFMVGI